MWRGVWLGMLNSHRSIFPQTVIGAAFVVNSLAFEGKKPSVNLPPRKHGCGRSAQ
jgi:hypothetical protein